MGFELGPEQKALDLLKTPGPMLALLGGMVMLVSFLFFQDSAPSTGDVDALLEAKANTGQSLKSMIGLVVGVVLCVAGALWSLMTFSRGR